MAFPSLSDDTIVGLKDKDNVKVNATLLQQLVQLVLLFNLYVF